MIVSILALIILYTILLMVGAVLNITALCYFPQSFLGHYIVRVMSSPSKNVIDKLIRLRPLQELL